MFKPGLAAMIGGLLGYAYYYFIGCASGSCPITGNPYVATIFGALMAVTLVGWEGPEKRDDNGQ
ncbi:MAG: YtxH domain-containing protein [Deltaproteobacteria bacterium]|nr:YtxH domain-containing protein [Deltaproteobacteria bacterium]